MFNKYEKKCQLRANSTVTLLCVSTSIPLSKKRLLITLSVLETVTGASVMTLRIPSNYIVIMSHLPDAFIYLADVDNTILQSVRYATSDNFLGRPVEGYESEKIILTEMAANALSKVQKELQNRHDGKYTLVVFDGYRPQTAVDDFITWSKDGSDIKMKAEYYPSIEDKTKLFELGYIAAKSSHSRGSTADLSIALTPTEPDAPIQYLDMGSGFDVLDPISNYHCSSISEEAKQNRALLRELMEAQDFEPYDEEWWHFTLRSGPFPDTYFSFPVK